ncbi:hypothetical protein AAEX63_04635 [Luteococcus sp. H138]|uniref:hypothetical protein n=1 Tax=unclassified Luteococcus TaxID=2639923 RepID=UPI00313D57F5
MSIRSEWLDTRYDFWLDFYGAPWKARRQLRRELKANLAEASAEVGWERARDGLGSIRLLAKQSADAVRDPRRPAWNSGAVAAMLAFALICLLSLFASAAFIDGAMAAGLNGRTVSDRITLLPGVEATAMDRDDNFQLQTRISPWLLFGLPAVCFLLASRIWRMFGRR